jgi:cyclophilin family peptidyl-prolyl cis-trans isomerase
MTTKYRTTKQKRKAAKPVSSSRQPQTQRNLLLGAVILLGLVLVGWQLLRNNDEAGSGQTVQPTLKQYDEAPAMSIDTTKQYFASVKMAKGGEFVIQLFPDKAPITVNSFVFLAREGYFDGVTFHRVLDGFMAQAGDPTGTGRGGPGYTFVNEDNELLFDKAGVVAMANAGRDTNGSQFFITFGPAPHLNGGYTIFGQVISGMEVVNQITRRNPDANPSFEGDAILSITISEK